MEIIGRNLMCDTYLRIDYVGALIQNKKIIEIAERCAEENNSFYARSVSTQENKINS